MGLRVDLLQLISVKGFSARDCPRWVKPAAALVRPMALAHARRKLEVLVVRLRSMPRVRCSH